MFDTKSGIVDSERGGNEMSVSVRASAVCCRSECLSTGMVIDATVILWKETVLLVNSITANT